MKKLFQIGAVLCGLLVTQFSFAQDQSKYSSTSTQPQAIEQTQDAQARPAQDNQNRPYQGRFQGRFQGGEQGRYQDGWQPRNYQNAGSSCAQGECPADHPCEDQPCNDCWCLYVHYEPCYYTTKRCIEEQIPCKKRCCRYVDKQYEVQRCRYVPQYYCETCCCKVPEYYDVDDCKTCKRWVCDQQCEYVPKYYWKHVCKPDCNPCQ